MSASSQISSAESKATQPQARREQEILRAASKTFAARGFRNTDVQEIADLVGVGKGTIYRAFPSKEALFFAAVDHGMQLLNEAMADRGDEESSPSSRLQQKIFTFLSFFEAHEELIELLIQERSEFRDRQSHSYTRNWLSNSERWRARIQTSIDEGRFLAMPVDGFIDVLNDLLYGAIFTHYFSKRERDLQTTAKLISDIVMHGVLSDTEREKLKR